MWGLWRINAWWDGPYWSVMVRNGVPATKASSMAIRLEWRQIVQVGEHVVYYIAFRLPRDWEGLLV
jgi:hypothetical protein